MLKEIRWIGSSKKDYDRFPEGVRIDFAAEIERVRSGMMPLWSRPMQSIASGVFELKTYDERSHYRVIYYTKIHNAVGILHCFEKRSGKTSKKDLNTAKLRLKAISVGRSDQK